ncbi:MAG TPA: hypothetical protein VGC36_04970 [Rhizomicrobium sp.]
MRVSLLAGSALALLLAGPANAAWDDWQVDPWTGFVGDMSYSVGGQVNGTVFDADQLAPAGHWGDTGAATLNASLQRDYDSGMSLAVHGTFELYADKLSGDNYGSNFLAKLYGSMQTGLGRVEVGMADGAAYQLSITGPTVNPEVTVDNPNATFFRDPSLGGAAFINVFALNSAVESSLNYAKISYFSPRLFGLQIGLSFTPSEGKQVIPFLNNGPDVPNRQKSMWEAAFNYSDSFGPLTLSAYGGLIVGHADNKLPGHAGVTDWGFGAQADYDLDDDTKLAFGGAYRQANTFTFDIYSALAAGATRSMHLSTVLSHGSWSLGAEFGNGGADGSLGLDTIGTHAYLIDVGYAVNSNLQLSGGWQRLNYSRSGGAFYNGLPRIEMDALFLHAVVNI